MRQPAGTHGKVGGLLTPGQLFRHCLLDSPCVPWPHGLACYHVQLHRYRVQLHVLTFWWPAKWCMICTSRCTSAMSSAVVSLRLEIDLQASTCPVFLSVQRRVVPNCPLPNTLPMSYLQHMVLISRQALGNTAATAVGRVPVHATCAAFPAACGLQQTVQPTYSDLTSGVCFPRTQSTVNGFRPALPGGAACRTDSRSQ